MHEGAHMDAVGAGLGAIPPAHKECIMLQPHSPSLLYTKNARATNCTQPSYAVHAGQQVWHPT